MLFKVFIKDFYINGVLKTFTPFWIDQDGNLENDPYTSDCTSQTNINTPHAYADIVIHNGKLFSKTCIEKASGKNLVPNSQGLTGSNKAQNRQSKEIKI